MELQSALERLREFSLSWNDEDVVDETSQLTGADLKLIAQLLGSDPVPLGVAD